MNVIEEYYDNKYDEWERLSRHSIEFDITKRYLDKYITGKNLKIFDIGGGPGRYSIYLAQKGHRVSLLDLSGKNIEVAKEKSKEYGVELEAYIHGNALDLHEYKQEYDVVLLMGPLYHLVKEEDRKKALQEALRLLKPNGIIIASFISNFAPVQDYLIHLDAKINDINDVIGYLEDGVNDEEKGFTTAYFSSKDEAESLMNSFGLEELDFAGIENVLGSKEQEIMQLDKDQYNKWIEIGYQLSPKENLMGTSQHYLYIGKLDNN